MRNGWSNRSTTYTSSSGARREGPRRSSSLRTSASRQSPRELGEVTALAIERDGTTVLLRYDLVADRQSKPGALAGRLGREERLEHLVPVLWRNAYAIVRHPDLEAFAQ